MSTVSEMSRQRVFTSPSQALQLPNGQLGTTVSEQLLRALLGQQMHSRAAGRPSSGLRARRQLQVELLQVLCSCSAVPSDQVFNSMLDATVRTRSYGEAWDVLELLLKCGRKADKCLKSSFRSFKLGN